MDNKQIIKTLKLTMQLMELHDENVFKIRGYQSAIINIEREGKPLAGLDIKLLQEFPGIGKGLAEVILNIQKTGSHSLLAELLEKTPQGILEILEIKGLGPKKIKILWQELEITSVHKLHEACLSGQVAKIKGFGQKTQDSIIEALDFMASNQGKWLFADIEAEGTNLLQTLQKDVGMVAAVGDFARNSEIIDQLEFILGTDNPKKAVEQLNTIRSLAQDIQNSSPYRWGGAFIDLDLKVLIHLVTKKDFIRQKLLKTGTKSHLLSPVLENKTLAEIFYTGTYENETEAYEAAGLPFVPEDLREGNGELEWLKDNRANSLLEMKDLKGPLHNHSTYSDGRHSLKEMAQFCQSQGYEYLGIADHSQSAFYANGLDAHRIKQQQEEIVRINAEMAPFKVFKGIESDILMDGSLDYPEDVLASFDYIVASIHSGLSMDLKKATSRLLTAIQNPYTTILGHPTGRLLLRRGGYPIDHRAIIEACAKYHVVIEINANPWRLDLDWRWVRYAMDQGVTLSINPDAHQKEAFADMKYGVLVGRKGGLTKTMTLNTLGVEELSAFFNKRKDNIK